jgi:hypothetical protein
LYASNNNKAETDIKVIYSEVYFINSNFSRQQWWRRLEVADIAELLLVTRDSELTLLKALLNILDELGLGSSDIINL